MPAPDPKDLGPLAALAGTWEGDQGLDVSYHHAEGEIGETPYREKVDLKPFGPVDNGTQQLFGLDYRMSAFKQGEDEPFHTEVGYWLWDAKAGQVMRCFMVPRGQVVIAGGRPSRWRRRTVRTPTGSCRTSTSRSSRPRRSTPARSR
jgi:hypothetical protein